MDVRDAAAERAKAVEEAIARFTRQKKPVPEFLLKLAGKKPEAKAPEPEPTPEPVVAAESDVPAPSPEPDAAPDSDAEEAVEKVEKPVARRGRPRR